MKHRGPERQQFIVRYLEIDGKEIMVVHGFHRLCINGLNPKADQPFHIEDTVFCTNGEVWNCEQLEQEMNYTNKSGSDCECIAPYYRYCQNDFAKLVSKLDGDFGIGLFDLLDGKTYIARDRIGIRSLYYAIDSESNLFVASELKGIPTDFTNVRAFPPGQWACFDVSSGQFNMHTYFTFYEKEKTIPKPLCHIRDLAKDEGYLAYCKKVEQSLIAAVKKRFMSDRPIGCILSGGLDSTTVTAIACKLYREMNPTGPPMRTYTIGLEGGEDFKWARIAADHFGTDHHEFVISEEDFLNAIPEVIQ